MKQLTPKSFEMGGTEAIWAKPDEDLELHVDFKESVIGDTTFKLVIEEFEWPYMPEHYRMLGRIEIDTGFSEEEIHKDKHRVSLLIPRSTIQDWKNRRLDVRLVADRDQREWVVTSTTITIAYGD